ncbi:hypothetical protein J6590_068808 [Homalodisca vitripennis]|nr:hypothetical protein J6590_068808 [Homalodisca vitripennis]
MKSRSSSYHESEYPVDVSTDQEFCGKCKDAICNEMAIGCDGFCQLWYHPECVNIDNKTYAAINDISDKVKWFCADCEVKLEMLFRKSTKIDDGCDWPSIINVVLTELENQSKNNVALCGRIDNLTSNYQKLNTELEEGKASHKTLNTLISKSGGIKIMDSMHEPNTTDNFEVYVSRKRRSAMNRAQNRKSTSNATSREALASRPIFGEKTGSGTKLKTASKRSWVFISRLDTSLTKENIESYLKDSQIDDFLCFELETKYDTYKSFKIGVNDSAVDQITDPEFWDEGILVKEYIPLRKQHRGHFLGRQRG